MSDTGPADYGVVRSGQPRHRPRVDARLATGAVRGHPSNDRDRRRSRAVVPCVPLHRVRCDVTFESDRSLEFGAVRWTSESAGQQFVTVALEWPRTRGESNRSHRAECGLAATDRTGVFRRWLWYGPAREVSLVGTNDGKQRAAAECDGCGTIGIVQIWPDGRLQPLGQSDFCDCDASTLRVLETELDHDEIP